MVFSIFLEYNFDFVDESDLTYLKLKDADHVDELTQHHNHLTSACAQGLFPNPSLKIFICKTHEWNFICSIIYLNFMTDSFQECVFILAPVSSRDFWQILWKIFHRWFFVFLSNPSTKKNFSHYLFKFSDSHSSMIVILAFKWLLFLFRTWKMLEKLYKFYKIHNPRGSHSTKFDGSHDQFCKILSNFKSFV